MSMVDPIVSIPAQYTKKPLLRNPCSVMTPPNRIVGPERRRAASEPNSNACPHRTALSVGQSTFTRFTRP